ncbi:cardiac phospholamban [Latimeria chalumnae]|uniref:cardiac phospholamban n=1 Tax=Latimeria chalumnae TaxID=7897 RepID=UPI0003C10E9A|nr:PREDICTED: cardiac phospholamban [Latimeria chalumnae]|eukprot:XP_006000008.1 PREDICTED: cardiac phospholamban [Latimeria chalumnae]
MDKVQHATRSALRRASNIDINPQVRQNLKELFINFCLILICLLLICIIVMLL